MIFKKKSDLVFPTEIKIGEFEYNIEVNFSKKKNSSVTINDDTLVFRMSSYLSNKKANEHFHELLEKIAKKIEKTPQKSKKKLFKEVLEEGSFVFSNENYFIEYTKNRGVKLKENTFYVNFHTKPDLIQKHIVKLLISRYYDRLKEYLFFLNSESYKYNIKDFQLKLLDSKWGHCTPDNIILLNLKLLNADVEVLNYVIYHELAHIKVKNHSDRFWREVSRFCPDYKVLRKRLREKPPEVFM